MKDGKAGLPLWAKITIAVAIVAGMVLSGLTLLLATVAGFFLYLLPTIIAYRRKYHNATAIALLNIFLGWTVLGWIGALIWSVSKPPPLSASQEIGIAEQTATLPMEDGQAGLPMGAKLAIGMVIVAAVALYGWQSYIDKEGSSELANRQHRGVVPHQAGYTYADFAKMKEQECLQKGYARRAPTAVTPEKFCEAYGNIQAICKHDGKTGGVCE